MEVEPDAGERERPNACAERERAKGRFVRFAAVRSATLTAVALRTSVVEAE
jgi:hypothetical protein